MHGIHEGTQILDADQQLSGIVNGDVVVRPGCRVSISGIVNGDIIAEAGTEVLVSGIVNGRLIEQGGRAQVKGIVSGG
jgi:cytoskeletal protein CcmA (bactofilin family)